MLSRCFLDFSVGVGAFHMTESDFFLFLALFAYKTTGIFHQNMTMIFSAPEPKAREYYCDYMLSVINF